MYSRENLFLNWRKLGEVQYVLYECMCARVCVCPRVCVPTRTRVCLFARAHARVSVCPCAPVCVCAHVCVRAVSLLPGDVPTPFLEKI